jgi:hypothetical protein
MYAAELPDAEPLEKPTEVETEIVRLAKRASSAASDHLVSYRILVEEIRKAQLTPEQVTRCLESAGYAKWRISEVKRVAFVSDVMWREFKEQWQGFRPMLVKVRGANIKNDTLFVKRFFSAFVRFQRRIKSLAPSLWCEDGRCCFVSELPTDKKQISYTSGKWRVTVERREKPTKSAPKNPKSDETSRPAQ